MKFCPMCFKSHLFWSSAKSAAELHPLLSVYGWSYKDGWLAMKIGCQILATQRWYSDIISEHPLFSQTLEWVAAGEGRVIKPYMVQGKKPVNIQ